MGIMESIKNDGRDSLCMIVRNEERHLETCLASIAGWVDEVIIVDTGSSDNTLEIARRRGATVIQLPWPDDFSKARNESIRHASEEWVLILDADEELPPETASRIRVLASEPGVEAWTFTIISPVAVGEGAPSTRHLNLRMFRNRATTRFEGPVHEQVKPSILRHDPDADIRYSQLNILHHGYIENQPGRMAKSRRNIALLNESVASAPEDAFQHYNLAASYYAIGDLEEARQHYESAFRHLHPDASFASALYRNYAICLYALGEYECALKNIDKGLALYPDYPDLYFLKGQVFWDLGMLPQVRASFLRCTQFNEIPAHYTTTVGVTGFLAYENLVEVCERQGDLAAAVDYLIRAWQSEPSFHRLRRLALLLELQGLPGTEIIESVEGLSAELNGLPMARLLLEVGLHADCLAYIRGFSLADPEARLIKAECLLHLERWSDADKILTAVDHGLPQAPKTLKLHCLSRWLAHPRQNARDIIADFPDQNDPTVLCCRLVNSLVFPNTVPNVESVVDPENRQHLLDVALDALLLGDKDLALAVGGYLGNSSPDTDSAYLLLGRYSLERGYQHLAVKLLERGSVDSPNRAKAYHLLGTAYSTSGRYGDAFHYYLMASYVQPGEDYILDAFTQLINRCLGLITDGLNRQPGSTPLRQALFRLTSLKKKAHRLKGGGLDGIGNP